MPRQRLRSIPTESATQRIGISRSDPQRARLDGRSQKTRSLMAVAKFAATEVSAAFTFSNAISIYSRALAPILTDLSMPS
jgi:hypothetical protein